MAGLLTSMTVANDLLTNELMFNVSGESAAASNPFLALHEAFVQMVNEYTSVDGRFGIISVEYASSSTSDDLLKMDAPNAELGLTKSAEILPNQSVGSTMVEQLKELVSMKQANLLTDEEFSKAKSDILKLPIAKLLASESSELPRARASSGESDVADVDSVFDVPVGVPVARCSSAPNLSKIGIAAATKPTRALMGNWRSVTFAATNEVF